MEKHPVIATGCLFLCNQLQYNVLREVVYSKYELLAVTHFPAGTTFFATNFSATSGF